MVSSLRMTAVSASFLGLPSSEAFVEALENRVVPGGDEGGHVEAGADLGAAAPDGAPAAHGTAVPVEGGDADQGGDLPSVEAAEFGRSAIRVRAVVLPTPGTLLSRSSAWRQAGLRRTVASISASRSDSSRWSALSSRSTLLRARRLARRLRRLRSAVIISTIWRRRATSSASARACSSGTGRGAGATASAKWANRRGVQGVGLGELAGRPGEVADLARVDHRKRQARRTQRRRHRDLVAAGRLQHDQRRIEPAQPVRQIFQAFAVARDGKGLPRRPDTRRAGPSPHRYPQKSVP